MSPVPRRANYDEIAPNYDRQPERRKQIDFDLLAYLGRRPHLDPRLLAVLDIGCGTGNQLIANQVQIPDALSVGLDLSYGMLQQAQEKSSGLSWLQGDGTRLPLRDNAFDFVTNQFAFHHVQHKIALLQEVFRVLRPGGQFVLTNIAPHAMPDWLYYHYFPAAWERDMQDFLPKDVLRDHMTHLGFEKIEVTLSCQDQEVDLHDLLAEAQRRYSCSQLSSISDEDYQAGLAQIKADLAKVNGAPLYKRSELCLVKISGLKPAA